MGFHTLPIEDFTDSGDLKGISKEVACGCWFTASGKTIPLRLKVLDEEGCQRSVQILEVITSEEKNYSGIPSIEHVCKIELNQREKIVKLIFTKSACTWRLLPI